ERWAEEALGVGVLQRLDVERPVADLERLGEGGVDGGRLRRRGGPDQRGAAEAGGDPVDGGGGEPGVGPLAEERQAVSWLERLAVEGAGTEGDLAPARPDLDPGERSAGGEPGGDQLLGSDPVDAVLAHQDLGRSGGGREPPLVGPAE